MWAEGTAKQETASPRITAKPDAVTYRRVLPHEAVELLARLPLPVASRVQASRPASRPQLRYVPTVAEDASHAAVAAIEPHECFVGVGWCWRSAGSRVADVSVFVQDFTARERVAQTLIAKLIDLARELGAERIRASVGTGEQDLVAVLAGLSTHPTLRREGERVIVELPV